MCHPAVRDGGGCRSGRRCRAGRQTAHPSRRVCCGTCLRATTYNTLSVSRSTMCATRTTSAGMAAPRLDGRARLKMADWTSLRYVVVDIEGNGRTRRLGAVHAGTTPMNVLAAAIRIDG